MIQYEKINLIYLNETIKGKVINHCLRKLSGKFLPEETPEKQAYGLLGGQVVDKAIYIRDVFFCKANFRNNPGVQGYINNLVENYAIPAETPLNQRGWVIQPEELMTAYDKFEKQELELIGSYHMHQEASWQGDQPKEYPSKFDAKLSESAELLMFIISIKSKAEPSIKAFYNGLKDKEIKIINYAI